VRNYSINDFFKRRAGGSGVFGTKSAGDGIIKWGRLDMVAFFLKEEQGDGVL
jgi:hypothetical protein